MLWKHYIVVSAVWGPGFARIPNVINWKYVIEVNISSQTKWVVKNVRPQHWCIIINSFTQCCMHIAAPNLTKSLFMAFVYDSANAYLVIVSHIGTVWEFTVDFIICLCNCCVRCGLNILSKFTVLTNCFILSGKTSRKTI